MKKDITLLIIIFIIFGGAYYIASQVSVSKSTSIINTNVPKTNDLQEIFNCLPEQREADACIEIYQPVCAEVKVECITSPCEPIKETFPNSCFACKNSLIDTYTQGECSATQ